MNNDFQINKPTMKTQIQFRVDADKKAEAQHIINERGNIESLSSICDGGLSEYIKRHKDYLDNFKG